MGSIEHDRGAVLFDTGQDIASVTDEHYYPSGLLGAVYRRCSPPRADTRSVCARSEVRNTRLCNNHPTIPIAAVLLAALCLSMTRTAQALADVAASPLSAGAARVLIGGGILGLMALAGGRGRMRPTADAGSAHRVPS